MTAHGLSSWEASLGFLADDVAVGVERMAKRLDLAMGDPSATGGVAEPDGFAGLDRRGPFDRLLLSDWALSEFEPDEFLRRIAMAELSYLRVEQRRPRPPGRISILMDCGPDQIGAPRLVQLAGLAVLARRARVHDVELVVGIAGDEPGAWLNGELPELFSAWLRARRPTTVSAETVDAWNETLDRESSVSWLFGAPQLHDSVIPDRWRRLWATESCWGPSGATEVSAVVDGRSVNLELPDSSTSIRMLRGHGVRRDLKLQIAAAGSPVRFPRFPGSPRRLLCRGDGADELVVVGVPQSPGESGARPRARQFPGPVLAASVVGARTVALVAMEGGVRVVVVGKRLGAVDLIDISLSDLGLDHASVAGLVGGDLLPLYFLSGSIVVGFADQWWRIDAPSSVRRIFPAAIGASVTADQPWVVWSNTGQLWFGGVAIGLPQQGRGVMVGNHAHLGVEVGPGHWRIYQRGATSEIRIDDEATGLGLVHLDGLPTLLVQSPGGRLLRLENTAGASKTLTKFSGDLADVAVHPTEPLLAMQRDNGAIDVADLATGEVLLHLGTNRR